MNSALSKHAQLELRVGRHAARRYVERIVQGISLNEARARIEKMPDPSRIRKIVNFIGPHGAKLVVNGTVLCVRDGTITTCYPIK